MKKEINTKQVIRDGAALKQIEKMADKIKLSRKGICLDGVEGWVYSTPRQIAQDLYDEGCRILSKEAQEMVSNALVYSKRLKMEKSAEQVRKGTAKEIRDKIIANKDMPEPIKNEWKKWFNKEYGVEIEE